MQDPQPDDSARQACVVRRRAMRGLWVGIVAGWLRFMHQRQSVLTPGKQRSRNAPIDFASIGHPTTKTQYVVTMGGNPWLGCSSELRRSCGIAALAWLALILLSHT